VAPDARLTDVFGDGSAASDRVAVVDGACFVGIVESRDAVRLLATRGPEVRSDDAVRPDEVRADLGWTVGDAQEVLDDDTRPAIAVVDGERFLGVVTPATILALTTRLQ
jgi:hypothetical protein